MWICTWYPVGGWLLWKKTQGLVLFGGFWWYDPSHHIPRPVMVDWRVRSGIWYSINDENGKCILLTFCSASALILFEGLADEVLGWPPRGKLHPGVFNFWVLSLLMHWKGGTQWLDQNFHRDWDFKWVTVVMMIYILWWGVCVSVTKNHHFLLWVSCNHLNHP